MAPARLSKWPPPAPSVERSELRHRVWTLEAAVNRLTEERNQLYELARVAARHTELIQRLCMTESSRATVDDALSIAQTARTQMRLHWIDAFIDALIAIFPDQKAEFDLMRIDLHESNEAYVEALNNVDRVLVNRVTAIVLNAQLDREERGS